jgi:hypothetical protein
MRILFVIDGLPGGGAEKVVLTLAEHFLRQGERVSLFSLRDVCDYALPEGLDYQVVSRPLPQTLAQNHRTFAPRPPAGCRHRHSRTAG